MHHLRRVSSLAALFSFATLVACGSAGDSEQSVGPAPTEPVVYNASAETKQSVGIAKWGYATDAANSATIFRGYGSRNELLVEIRQSYVQKDAFTKSFELEMTGSMASGSEQIDFVAEWTTKDEETMEYVTHVRQNTFAAGSVGARILARLQPDASAGITTTPTTGANGSLTQSVHPLDDTTTPSQTATPGMSGLVSPGSDALLVCCQQLTQESAAASAAPASDCPLVEAGDDPLTTRELVLGADGKTPTVKSPWTGAYNIVDHHCHNAAAQNSSKTDGYIGCTGASSTTTTQGHTINWGPDPSAGGKAGAYCAYEPQSNGGTSSSKSVCCWQGDKAADGSPLLNAPASQGCVKQLCLGQANFGGTAPKAFPAGSTPMTPNDCPSSTQTQATCNTCCTTQADNVNSLFGAKAPYTQQIADYRKRCASGCLDAETARKPKMSPAQKCQAGAQNASTANSAASQTCSAPKK